MDLVWAQAGENQGEERQVRWLGKAAQAKVPAGETDQGGERRARWAQVRTREKRGNEAKSIQHIRYSHATSSKSTTSGLFIVTFLNIVPYMRRHSL